MLSDNIFLFHVNTLGQLSPELVLENTSVDELLDKSLVVQGDADGRDLLVSELTKEGAPLVGIVCVRRGVADDDAVIGGGLLLFIKQRFLAPLEDFQQEEGQNHKSESGEAEKPLPHLGAVASVSKNKRKGFPWDGRKPYLFFTGLPQIRVTVLTDDPLVLVTDCRSSHGAGRTQRRVASAVGVTTKVQDVWQRNESCEKQDDSHLTECGKVRRYPNAELIQG